MKTLCLLVLSLLFSTPCLADTPKTVAVDTVQTASNPPQKLPEAKILQIKITHHEDLEWDDKKGTVTFNADSGRMTDHFHYYVFEAKAFAKMLGGKDLKTPITVFYMVLTEDKKQWTPTDKNSPHPQGGFKATTVRCKLVKIEKGKEKND